jgi:hypothetical protein
MKQLLIITLIMGILSWTSIFGQNKKTKENKYIDINKPIENPELKKSFSTFIANKNEKNLEVVVRNLIKANFIVLVYTDEMKTTKGNQTGVTIIDTGSKIKYFNIFNSDNKPFLPLFTDWQEVDLWLKTRDSYTNGFIMTSFEVFEWIATDKFYNGVVINPGSIVWTMGKDKLKNFRYRRLERCCYFIFNQSFRFTKNHPFYE